MASSVTSSVTIRGSLPAAMFIPGLPNTVQIVDDDLSNAGQFLCREFIIICQDNGFEPEFANGPVPAHMDVPRFITVETVEEKPERARDTGNCWQRGFLQMPSRRTSPSPPQCQRFREAKFPCAWVCQHDTDRKHNGGLRQGRKWNDKRKVGKIKGTRTIFKKKVRVPFIFLTQTICHRPTLSLYFVHLSHLHPGPYHAPSSRTSCRC